MGKYFVLQLKRVARFLPFAFCVVLVLFGCMRIVYQGMVTTEEQETVSDGMKFQIGVVGAAGDTYLQWGLAAMQFDSSSMSLKLIMMEENAAIEALGSGQISAYIVFPEGFMDQALRGDIQKLRFVSTTGAADMAVVIKEEVTAVVDRILVACESGSYGVGDALADQNISGGEHVNGMSLEFVDFLLERSRVYRVEESEQLGHISLARYMPGALSTMLLLFSCLAFAPLYIRGDQSMARLLCSQRIGVTKQVLAELAGYGLGLMVLLAAMSAILSGSGMVSVKGWQVFMGMLPGLWMFAAMAYLIYSLSDQLIGGILATFFLAFALCYVGGCLYPIRMFPDVIQHLSAVLPSGIARAHTVNTFLGIPSAQIPKMVAYTGVFAVLSVAVRYGKVGKVRG